MKTFSLSQIWLMLVLTGISATASNAGVSTRSDDKSPVFIQNKGQWPEVVLYLTKLNGLNAWITTSRVTYDHFTIIMQYYY